MNQLVMQGLRLHAPSHVKNARLIAWVAEIAALTQPDRIHWCDGSQEEYDRLCEALVDAGTFRKLNPAKRPNTYLACSDPSDVARVEDRTFICSRHARKTPARPTTGWRPPRCARTLQRAVRRLHARAARCTWCRSRWARWARRSPTSASSCPTAPTSPSTCSIMTRMGKAVYDVLGVDGEFVPCVHTVGAPLAAGPEGRRLALQQDQVHRPLSRRRARSGRYGSGYGGNALLGKKCFALRIASTMGRDAGLAGRAHADPRRRPPEGKKHHVAAAFPTACGKTNFAMLIPPQGLRGLEGHHHRRRHRLDQAGRRRPPVRDQPGGRLLRRRARAPTTRPTPTAWPACDTNVIFTNVALTDDGDVWWEGMTEHAAGAPDRLAGQGLDAGDRQGTGAKAAHPNARFTVAATNNPALDPAWDDPAGVPIDAFIFGGRRSTTVPLVTEARNWVEGVYMAATMGSETTAAAAGQVGVVRRDPFAMLPFTGYNMSDYFQHWLDLGTKLGRIGRHAAAHLHASTGSARATTASSSGRATARTCACSSG